MSLITRVRPSRDLSLSEKSEKLGDFMDDLLSPLPSFDQFFLKKSFPAMEIYEDQASFTIKAELPTMSKEDIKVDINKNRIIISGDKKREIERNDVFFHLAEIWSGSFSRRISPGFDFDPKSVSATFENNVLTIIVKKPNGENLHSHSIPISGH